MNYWMVCTYTLRALTCYLSVYIIVDEITQDRNQAYTSLVEGVEGMKLTKKVMHDHEYIVKKTPEEILTDILENVVKPLYGKE